MKTSGSVASLMPALLRAQKKLTNITPDATNPHYRSTYATLQALCDHIREVAHGEGLAVIQTVGSGARGPIITTSIWHAESCEYLEDAVEIPCPDDPQKYVACCTYMRRASLPGIFLIATEPDDDGNTASGIKVKDAVKASKAAPPAAPPGMAGGEPETVEGSIKAYTKPETSPFGVMIGSDWFSTYDDAMAARLKKAKEDKHRIAIDWKWQTIAGKDGQARDRKFITTMVEWDDQGEIIGE